MFTSGIDRETTALEDAAEKSPPERRVRAFWFTFQFKIEPSGMRER